MTDLNAVALLPQPCMQCWEIFEPEDLNGDQVCLKCGDPELHAEIDREKRLAEVDRKITEMASSFAVPPSTFYKG